MKKSIQNLLKEKKKILLIAPINWNGDDISAMIALQSVLKKLGKEVIAVGPNDKPFKFAHLDTSNIHPNIPKNNHFIISLDTSQNKSKKIQYRTNDNSIEILVIPESGNFSAQNVSFRKGIIDLDLIITIGVSHLESLGSVFESNTDMFSNTPLINLSVSPENEYFGTINAVDTTKSSVCEIVFDFIEHDDYFKDTLTPDIATLLLTGIIDNTESFLDTNTQKNSFHTASKLYTLNADHNQIIDHLFKQKKLSTLKAWGEILKNLEVDPVHRIAWTSINQSEFQDTKSTPEEVSDLNDELLQYIQNIDLSLFFVEKEDSTVIQVRSGNTQISIPKLNAQLGNTGIVQKHGLDFHIQGKNIIEIEYEFLRLILDIQTERLHIEPNIPLQKMDIVKKPETRENKSTTQQTPAQKTPKAPEVIPFEVLEKNSVVEPKNTPPAQVDPVKENPKEDKNLPKWLRHQ